MLLFIQEAANAVPVIKKFQYITCYSLSTLQESSALSPLCFNTSHVTLYRCICKAQKWRYIVSIHHMLLFINISVINALSASKFQYITCYSLSTVYRTDCPGSVVSIHHMLLFIHFHSAKCNIL